MFSQLGTPYAPFRSVKKNIELGSQMPAILGIWVFNHLMALEENFLYLPNSIQYSTVP